MLSLFSRNVKKLDSFSFSRFIPHKKFKIIKSGRYKEWKKKEKPNL